MRTKAKWARFLAAPQPLREHSLVCTGAGEYEGIYRPFEGRRLDSYALVIVSKGSGRYVDARHPEGLSVSAPAILWAFPSVEHGYGPGVGGWSEHWVLFSGRTATAYEQLGLLSRTKPVVELKQLPVEAMGLFVELRDTVNQAGERHQLLASLLCQRIIVAAAVGDDAGGDDVISRFGSQAFTPMSIEERALSLGLSVAELRAVVAHASGSTPLEYLVQLRIARACLLLAETTASVNEVAASVGYDDPAYFTRLFTRRVGTAPTRFRAQQSRLETA